MGIRGGQAAFVGEQRIFAGSLPAGGWLECDGALYDGADYPALYAKIGTTYNAGGEAAGFFRVPDKRGRGSIGRGQGSGLTNRTHGQRIGAEAVALTQEQLAVHTHSQNAHGHSGVTTDNQVSSGTGVTKVTNLSASSPGYSLGSTNGTTATNNNTGSGSDHNNMAPVEVDIWGIKF